MGKMNSGFILFLSNILFTAVFFLPPANAQEQSKQEVGIRSIPLKSEVTYGSGNLRDPFKSLVQSELLVSPGPDVPAVTEVSAPPLKIQGIVWGGNFPQAIINDKVVKVGDTIEGAQLLSIEKDSVTVFFVNRQFILSSPASENLANSPDKGKKEDVHEN